MVNLKETYLEKHLPKEPITNIKELQYLYGVINMASRGYTADHGVHLTNFGNSGKEDSVITIDFERSNDSLNYVGISTEKYTDTNKQQHEKLCFVRYVESSRGKEHSITQKSSKDPDIDNVISKADWLLDWINEDAVQDSMNGWLKKSLESINNNIELRDQIKQDIRESLAKDSVDECLITIRIKEDGVWKYPGEYEQLVTAMEERKLRKSLDKSSFDVLSKGRGTTFITQNESDELVGSPSDSLNSYKTKQQSTFSNLRADESSWMQNPTSYTESLHIGLSDEIISEMYINVLNHRVYIIPYYTHTPTVENINILYELIDVIIDKDDFLKAMLRFKNVREKENSDIADNLRYYIIGLSQDQNILYNILYTIPQLRRSSIVEMAEKYENIFSDVTGNTVFTKRDIEFPYTEESVSDVMESREYYKIYMFDVINENGSDWDTSLHQNILYGLWIEQAFYDEYSGDFAENDVRTRLYQSILDRSSFAWSTFIQEAVKKLIHRANDRIKDNKAIIPKRLIAHQQMMLQTLIDSDILTVPEPDNSTKVNNLYVHSKNTMTKSEPAQNMITAIEELPESLHTIHHYAFAIGAVVGRLAAHQRSQRDMSKTIVNDHPVDRMNMHRLKQAASDFVDKASVYNLYGYSDQINIIRELHPDTEDSVRDDDIKYFYSLGLAFGNSEYYRQSNEE